MLTNAPLRTKGFSLVELMVALALLGLLLKLGIPSFAAMIKNTQVRTVADALQNGLRVARTEALRTNQQTVFALTNSAPALNLTPAAGGKNWWVQTIPHAGGDTASAVQNGSGALGDVASGVAISGGPAVLCFNSNGRLTDLGGAATGLGGTATCSASPATFTVTQNGTDFSLKVLVAIGGQVRLCDARRTYSASTATEGC